MRPRLSVFRSNKAIYCQAIDDINGVTIVYKQILREETISTGVLEKVDQAKGGR